MASSKPTASVRAEIRPEFNQFALGTGDVLMLAGQLGGESASSAALGVFRPGGALFSLAPGVVELSVSIELWAEQPEDLPEPRADSIEFQLVASDTALHLVSITPSPRDVRLLLPDVKSYTVQAFALERELRHTEDFDLRVERWLIRLW
jgi:hypothetical protein